MRTDLGYYYHHPTTTRKEAKTPHYVRPQKYKSSLDTVSGEDFDFVYKQFLTKRAKDKKKPPTATTIKDNNDTFRLLIDKASTGKDFYRLVLLQQKGIGFGNPWGGFLQKAANAGVKEARELRAKYTLQGYYGVDTKQLEWAFELTKDLSTKKTPRSVDEKDILQQAHWLMYGQRLPTTIDHQRYKETIITGWKGKIAGSKRQIPHTLNLPVPNDSIKPIQSLPLSEDSLKIIEELSGYMGKVDSTGGWSKKHQFAHGNFGLFKTWQAQNRHATYLLATTMREQLMSGMPINEVFKNGNIKKIEQYRRELMKENGYALQDHGINSKDFNEILHKAGVVVQNAEHRYKK